MPWCIVAILHRTAVAAGEKVQAQQNLSASPVSESAAPWSPLWLYAALTAVGASLSCPGELKAGHRSTRSHQRLLAERSPECSCWHELDVRSPKRGRRSSACSWGLGGAGRCWDRGSGSVTTLRHVSDLSSSGPLVNHLPVKLFRQHSLGRSPEINQSWFTADLLNYHSRSHRWIPVSVWFWR